MYKTLVLLFYQLCVLLKKNIHFTLNSRDARFLIPKTIEWKQFHLQIDYIVFDLKHHYKKIQ